nr:hypothetical protein BgiMline_016051 [Biomphalaria glabrata]
MSQTGSRIVSVKVRVQPSSKPHVNQFVTRPSTSQMIDFQLCCHAGASVRACVFINLYTYTSKNSDTCPSGMAPENANNWQPQPSSLYTVP